MKGYVRTNDFEAFNKNATERIKAAFPTESDFESYTFSTPDSDSEYCWARVEGQWYDTASDDERALIRTKDEAISEGMVIPTAEG